LSNTTHRRRKTEQQIQNELIEIEHRICQGYTDKEIMEDLGLKERTFYYYKEKLYQKSAQIQANKTEQILVFEAQILKDRLTHMYRQLQQRVRSENTKARDLAEITTTAYNIAINIFKLESEGLRAFSTINKLTNSKVVQQQISQN
jgi:Putative ATPase subunit of terminase (gpP-like)